MADSRAQTRVVLLHGFSDCGASWAPFARKFPRDRELHAPDAPGHGGRPVALGEFTPELLAADAIQLLDRHRSRTVIGHSMGARTAMEIAAQRPELIDFLVLEDPPLWPGPPELELQAAGDVNAPPFADVRRAIRLPEDQRESWVETVTPDWTAYDRRIWIRALGALDANVFGPRFFSYTRGWRETLQNVQAPTLVIRGEFGLVADNVAVAAADLLPPGSAVVTIHGASHSPRRERPAETLREIARFLDF